jgi:hypothetical protein
VTLALCFYFPRLWNEFVNPIKSASNKNTISAIVCYAIIATDENHYFCLILPAQHPGMVPAM